MIEATRPDDTRRGVYLLTHPRSASNLFHRMMSKQPGFRSRRSIFFSAGFASLSQLRKGRLSEWPEEERRALYDTFRAGFDILQDELEDAGKNGEQMLMKEHVMFLLGPAKFFAHFYDGDEVQPLLLYERDAPESSHTNPTGIPDSILLSLTPIFQIRHPILMFPSMLRAEQKFDGPVRPRQPTIAATLTLRHSRDLYDWYSKQQNKKHPQIIDADDIINDRAAMRHVCVETGLDPDAVQYEWEIYEEKDPRRAAFTLTLNASKGIIPSLTARGLDLETEKARWKAEFGDEDAEDLAEFVLRAMPDYNYLLSRRTYIGHMV